MNSSNLSQFETTGFNCIAFLKKNILRLVIIVLVILIIAANFENLGDQKNQLIKFVTVQNLTYDA